MMTKRSLFLGTLLIAALFGVGAAYRGSEPGTGKLAHVGRHTRSQHGFRHEGTAG